MTDEPTGFPELNEVLRQLVSAAREAVSENFCGASLQGSFATGDAGAAAFLHGPEGLFPTDIPTQTLGALREDQGHDDAEETVR